MVQLMRYGSEEPVKEGDQLSMVGSGEWCYLVEFRPPLEDDDLGRVTVRLPWHETKNVEPSKVGCYFKGV